MNTFYEIRVAFPRAGTTHRVRTFVDAETASLVFKQTADARKLILASRAAGHSEPPVLPPELRNIVPYSLDAIVTLWCVTESCIDVHDQA
jgi:hypothetical protein